jgi:fatty-acyl-CoA synthase
MWDLSRGRLVTFAGGLRAAPARVRTAARLGLKSGMLWTLTPPGLTELLRVLARGSLNPSLAYRINARNAPSKPALIAGGRTTSWGELDERIDRLSAGFARRAIGRRSSVLLLMRNRQEFIEVAAAAARGGAAAVAVSWRSTPRELLYLAVHSGASAIVTEPELLATLEQVRGELPEALLENVFVVGATAPRGGAVRATALDSLYEDRAPRGYGARQAIDEDAAVVIYTSGTTGKPKGAVRRFPKAAMDAAFGFLNETPLRVDDVHLVTCPLYHSTAFGFLSLATVLGQTIVLMDEWNPSAFLRAVEQHGVTTTAVVPTMLHRLLELPRATRDAYDTSSLRAVFSGGAPLPAPVALAFMDTFGDVLFNFYGATETGLVTLGKPADLRAAPGTIGRALPGNEIRLLDDAGREVGEGEVGELYVKNQLLVAGYLDDPAATAASMRSGFFSVGDLARRDASGRYFLEGRKRDLIISGGVNVYPAEIEAVFEEHPGVAEVAVVGVPDAEWGERVRAFVVARSGVALSKGELSTFARERLAGPKVPRDIVLVEALPRNPTGKVEKRALRERGA